MFKRYSYFALLCCLVFSSGSVFAKDVQFHFYGAFDCPPCMAFKRDGLPVVQASAQENGFRVAVNIIDKTADVPTKGVYGKADTLLRVAGKQLKYVYPPIFFLTVDGEVHSVHGAKWREAHANAVKLAASN